MSQFLVKKMFYDPQTALQGQSRKYIANHQITIPPYQPDMLRNMYRVGAKGAYNTLQTGKFTLPVNIYDKSGKLKPYKLIAKELKTLRNKTTRMNVNGTKKKSPNVSKKNTTKKAASTAAPEAAAPAAAPQTLRQKVEENMANGENNYTVLF